MPKPNIVIPSVSQIDKAGRRMRRWWNSPDPAAAEELKTPENRRAIITMLRYREAHEYPLRKVTVGVRQFVARESDEVLVAQRLKRLPTIVGKLARHPNMATRTWL